MRSLRVTSTLTSRIPAPHAGQARPPSASSCSTTTVSSLDMSTLRGPPRLLLAGAGAPSSGTGSGEPSEAASQSLKSESWEGSTRSERDPK